MPFEQPSQKKEIQYSAALTFRSADGNFEILRPFDRTLTKDDIANGYLSSQEKTDLSFSRVFEGLPRQLHDPSMPMSPERKAVVGSLRAGKPVFLPLDRAKIDDGFVRAAEHFPDARPGAILFPETGAVMNQFSAIGYPDGRFARLLRGPMREELEDLVRRTNLLTPRIEAKALDGKEVAYAMEFVKDGERPTKITRQEMEDWLVRVGESGLIFDFDVGEQDPSLDNFIRKGKKLFWVDGNILGVRMARNDDELRAFEGKQRRILGAYVQG